MSDLSDLPLDADAEALLAPWPGRLGGLPPFDRLTPSALETAFRIAVQHKRDEIDAIARDPSPPSFTNTIEALEDAGRALGRLRPLAQAAGSLTSGGEMAAVIQQLAPLAPALDEAITHDALLFARVAAVHDAREQTGLSPEQQRLVEEIHRRFVRAGADLPAARRQRLEEIEAKLAELSNAYRQRLMAAAEDEAVFVDDPADLDGLPDEPRRAAAAAAEARGRPGAWAIVAERAAVWPFLTHATRRGMRERVWRMWTGRGDHDGPRDTRPLIAEMLQLRGEKARLLGHASYAHHALAGRMLSDPDAVAALLESTWGRVIVAARGQVADYQAIADREGAGFTLAPWDRLHYAEKLRRERFGVDSGAVREHLALDAMLAAMFWSAGRLHGLTFTRIDDAPLLHPSCRAYAVSRGGSNVGVLYLDLIGRTGKLPGSYQQELRPHESFRGQVLPVSMVVSSLPASAEGEPVLLPWEYANVLFHEFGHALHMLCGEAAYPSLGSMHVAWDLIELPALINERWLIHGDVLQRFARHHRTGKTMPPELIARLEASLRYERIFSLNLDYLLPAIVDLRMHRLADGSGTPIDAVQLERETMAELGMPEAWDLIMRVTHSFHSFVGAYAAGVYAYLWADVMAADAAETFLRAPGGLYDPTVARAWSERLLSVGHAVPAGRAFRDFAGHDPSPEPLLRRFGLLEAASA